MSFNRRWLPALILALAALAWASPAHAQATLRYKFKKGDTLNYVLEQKIKTKTEVAGQAIDSGIDQNMEMAWNVDSVSDKGAKIKMAFGRIKMALDTPMGKIELDSNNKDEPNDVIGKMLQPMIKSLANLEISFMMDDRGQISDVTIPEKAMENLKKLGAAGGFGDMFSEDGLKQMVAQGLVFPKDAVEKGKKWDNKTTVKTPFGKVVSDNEFTYQGSEDKGGVSLEKIGFKPTIKMEADPNAKVAIKMKSADAKGTIGFDNKAGRIAELTQTQNMVMEGDNAGATITVTIDTTSVMKLKQAK